MFTQREAPDTVLEREPGALVMCEHCYTVDGIEASWVEFRFFYGPVLMGWVR